MVKGIPWLYPDVENAVHPPLPHVTGFSHLSDTNMAVLSPGLNSDRGKSIFWLGIHVLQERGAVMGLVLYWFSKAVSLVNIKMT